MRRLPLFSKHGSFDVSGNSSVVIPIGCMGRTVSVRFEDEEDCIMLPPCGGPTVDDLSWTVKKDEHGHSLEIRWDVTRQRHVEWSASWL